MEQSIKNTKHNKQSSEESKIEIVRMLLFMSFIPSIYLIGKLISDLF
jgi:hypothetical protein